MAVEPGSNCNWLGSRVTWALLVFLAVAAFYLLTEHTAHLFGALPFLLFLLCPLMHLFMHGSHGGDHTGHAARSGQDTAGSGAEGVRDA